MCVLTPFCSALAADTQGNLFVVDSGNCLIRKVCVDGTVSTFAGTGERGYRDGRVEEAQFGDCFGIAVGSDGTLFVSDGSNQVIRMISNGVVTTLAGKGGELGYLDGKGEEARFWDPRGVCLDSDGSLLVVDSENYRIRRVSMDGVVTTLVGTEEYSDEENMSPSQICRNGDVLYVSDFDADCVRKISNESVVSLGISGACSVCFLNGELFTVSYFENRIYQGEEFQLFAGSGEEGHKDGTLLESSFQRPQGIVGSNRSLFVCDRGNHCIRRISLFVEWRPDTHLQTPKSTRDAVKTLMMMRMKGLSVWSGLPRDILFLS